MYKNTAISTMQSYLHLLFQAQYVFGNGTFKHAPKHFMQLYTIHTHMCGFYVPIIYCFLQSKSDGSYFKMWEGVRQLCFDSYKLLPHVQNFASNFEQAAHSTIVHFYPNCRILGCNFHLGQFWYRRICSDKVLREEYAKKESKVGS